jgi:bis(5'-nucleosyl)-tetraphosphatase (symmetrical)
LGNHDLHALAVHYGVREGYADDTLDAILASPKRDGLMNWLRHRPLMHHEHGFTMAHAGIYPEWSVEQALGYAAEVEAVVQNDDTVTQYLETMYGNEPDCFTEALTGFDRLRVITNAFTRMRFVTADGHLDMKVNTKTIHPDPQFTPWFTVPKRAITTPVLFGHWAALEGDIHQTEYKVVALDTGCVWGNALTAFRLDDQKLFSYRCK